MFVQKHITPLPCSWQPWLHRMRHSCIYLLMATEIETTLVVLGDEPKNLLEELSTHKSIGPYHLTSRGMNVFTDTYYDTVERSLSGRRIALRTRDTAGSVIFCIKQGEHIQGTGTAVREELELPWSRQCLDHAARIIQDPPTSPIKGPSNMDTPAQCLAYLGLVPIQSRKTKRQVFDISDAFREETLAELALDEVSYSIPGCSILHYEIEVEATSPSFENHIVRFTDLLRSSYPEKLMRWDHNKLITGIAMEELMKDGRIASVPGKMTRLSRSSYDVIDAFLKKI
jgi:inorganic triphosphatase YgiF